MMPLDVAVLSCSDCLAATFEVVAVIRIPSTAVPRTAVAVYLLLMGSREKLGDTDAWPASIAMNADIGKDDAKLKSACLHKRAEFAVSATTSTSFLQHPETPLQGSVVVVAVVDGSVMLAHVPQSAGHFCLTQ
jgi:hypothetical protein